MQFIDTHTHISDAAFAGCEDQAITRALEAGVTVMIQADVDSSEREAMYSLVERYPDVLRPMLGLYPGSVDDKWKDEVERLMPWFNRNPVAIGEIGLDYHYGAITKELQKEAFRTQLELASEKDLPVNIHLREAFDDFFSIIHDCRHLHIRGNLHAFSGSAEIFERLRGYGDWMVGIGGVLTFKNAGIAKDIIRIPTDRILLETDAPYLTPVPHRGERNESSYIPLIAGFLASLKGLKIEEIADITTENARRQFGL